MRISDWSSDVCSSDLDYLAHSLQEYRNGNREHALLSQQAKDLTDQQIAHLAAYFGPRPSHLRSLPGVTNSVEPRRPGQAAPATTQARRKRAFFVFAAPPGPPTPLRVIARPVDQPSTPRTPAA